ncbi:MAG: nitric oxide reductase subunit C [Gammaproteobacteria bacterium]|nr:MAG: nitric oxide reductase subunit C [Gammaproteobacteria bacterium]
MRELFTKGMARNIYYGGSLFFILVFLGLTFDTTARIPERAHVEALTESVARGKEVWEEYNCIGCHTLLGEGAYFAPELGNVFDRFGGSREAIKAFIRSRPEQGIPGRRSMPKFDMSEADLDALVDFLEWTSKIRRARDWPPNIHG